MRPDGPPELSIVVPCYNEEEALGSCAAKLTTCGTDLIARNKVSKNSRIVFVNDGSRDRTWELTVELGAANPMIGGICLSRNFGHQGALLCGLLVSPGDILISIDADLQDDVSAIEKMVDCFLSGH